MKHDSPTQFFSKLAHRVHPKIGEFYEAHSQFFNDQFVELVGLIIANIFVGLLSYYFVGFSLVVVLLFLSTPITLIVKYMMRKHWVWKRQ